MTTIILRDFKGELWRLVSVNKPKPYLYKDQVYWKMWWFASPRPHEFRHYSEVPLPIFTDWWSE